MIGQVQTIQFPVISNSTNYLTYEGLPWIVLAWVGLFFFRPFATLTHEIGHLIPALLLTKNKVSIRIGEQGSKWKGRFLDIIWEFNFKNGNEGFTGYDKKLLTKKTHGVIIVGGLISSFMMSLITAYFLFNFKHSTGVEIILVSWFCANALTFMRALIPVKLKPTKCFPDGPESDGMELKKLLFDKKIN